MARGEQSDLKRPREQLRDPLLTLLTLLLVFWMFVLAPLHAAAVINTDIIGFILALAVTGALLILSPRPGAVIAMLLAIDLSAAAAWLRLRQPSHVDVFLNASAWTLIGIALAWVVGRAVFAPGRITYHRVMGAILLYLAIGLTFVALYTFVALAAPDAFSGMTVTDSPAFKHHDLFQFWHADRRRRRHHAGASHGAKPFQRGSNPRPAVSRDPTGAAGDARDRG
jgi:hypothetical protein